MNKMLKKLAGMLILSAVLVGCGKRAVTVDEINSGIEENNAKSTRRE